MDDFGDVLVLEVDSDDFCAKGLGQSKSGWDSVNGVYL